MEKQDWIPSSHHMPKKIELLSVQIQLSIKAREENTGLYFYNMKWQGLSKHDTNIQKKYVSDIYFGI